MNFFQKHKSEFIVISGALLAGILSFYITLAVYPMLDNEDDFTNDMQVADTYDVDNSNEVMHNGVEVIIENEKPINNEEVVNDLVSDEQASKIKNGTEELSESIEEENKELSYDEVIAKINEEESEIFEDLFSASGENVSEILISNPEIAEKVSNILDEDEEADKVIETSAINSDVQNILVDDKATPKILKFEMPVSGEITLEFAKDKLGVLIIDDISLDVMNYVNEGLYQLKNKVPNDFKIKWIESRGIDGGYDTDALAQLITIKNNNTYGINLSSDYIKNIDKTITEFIAGEVDRQALVKINGKLQYNDFFKKASISNEVSELANKFRQNPSSLSFKEKVKLHMGLQDIAEEMDNLFIEHSGDISKVKDVVNIISSSFHPIIHEQGHILHRINVNNRFALLDKIEILNQKKLDTTIYNEFKNKYSSIASRVSEYATESPAEFVAEVYAKTLEGAKFDNDVLSLYAKYGGHSIL